MLVCFDRLIAREIVELWRYIHPCCVCMQICWILTSAKFQNGYLVIIPFYKRVGNSFALILKAHSGIRSHTHTHAHTWRYDIIMSLLNSCEYKWNSQSLHIICTTNGGKAECDRQRERERARTEKDSISKAHIKKWNETKSNKNPCCQFANWKRRQTDIYKQTTYWQRTHTHTYERIPNSLGINMIELIRKVGNDNSRVSYLSRRQ